MSRVSSLFYLYCVHALYPPTLLVNGIKWVYLHICVLGIQLALLMFSPRCPSNYLIYTYIFVITMESSFFTKLHKVCQWYPTCAIVFFCLHLIYKQYTCTTLMKHTKTGLHNKIYSSKLVCGKVLLKTGLSKSLVSHTLWCTMMIASGNI